MANDPPDDYWDDEEWEDYEDDELECTHCAGEAWVEVDDPIQDWCDENGYGPCSACNGTGLREHQTIF